MRAISAMLAVLLLASACAGSGDSGTARLNDPAATMFQHGMIPGAVIPVPGTSTTVPF